MNIVGRGKYNVPLWSRSKAYKSFKDRRKDSIMQLLKEYRLTTREISQKLGKSKATTITSLHEMEFAGCVLHIVKGKTYVWSRDENRRRGGKIPVPEGGY